MCTKPKANGSFDASGSHPVDKNKGKSVTSTPQSLAEFRASQKKPDLSSNLITPEERLLMNEFRVLKRKGLSHLITDAHQVAELACIRKYRAFHRQQKKNARPLTVYLVLAPPASGKSTICAGSTQNGDNWILDGDTVPSVRGVYKYNKAAYGESWWDSATFQQLEDMSGMSQAWWTCYDELERTGPLVSPKFKAKPRVTIVTAEARAIDAAILYARCNPSSRLKFVFVHYLIGHDEHWSYMMKRVANNEPNFKTECRLKFRDLRTHSHDGFTSRARANAHNGFYYCNDLDYLKWILAASEEDVVPHLPQTK